MKITAMQELFEKFLNSSSRDFYVHFMNERHKYIEKEKQQIKNAFMSGVMQGVNLEEREELNLVKTPKNYYDTMFNNEKLED
ncbi:MAG: hypothetical protein ABIP68_09625 [Ferruginibacter sp.]